MGAVAPVCPPSPAIVPGFVLYAEVSVNLDARLTRKEAAERIGVTPAAVGMWKVRGKLTTDESGRYRLGDVLEVERETRHHPNSRRQIQAA